MRTQAHICMRMHVRVPKTMKGKFFCIKAEVWNGSQSFSALKLRFGMNPTTFGSHSKPLVSQYRMPYMIHSQNTQKILRENLRFTRNNESKREFFTKHP